MNRLLLEMAEQARESSVESCILMRMHSGPCCAVWAASHLALVVGHRPLRPFGHRPRVLLSVFVGGLLAILR